MNILDEIENLSDENVWHAFAASKQELKKRGLVRTNNITGERGEFLVIETYRKDPTLPKLQAAPEGTQNIDAISRNGERYSIKTITQPGKTTGVFYGCGGRDDDVDSLDRKFEFLVIVLLDKDMMLSRMIEITWNDFLRFRKWHSTMTAWNISVTSELLKIAKIIF